MVSKLQTLLAIVGLITGIVQPSSLLAEPLTFEKDVRPIFRAHCFDCHGATAEIQGGLDLRLVRFMAAGGDSGPAFVSGKPEESYLLERVRSGEMPPGEHRVSDPEIAILAQWIAAGAPLARPEPESIAPGLGVSPEERRFWSFQPIRRPPVKSRREFPRAARVRTPIDALCVQQGMEFAADAERRVLVLRAHFVLTGLPPGPQQLERWLNDPSGDWFERMVEGLLSSPHYGERWARHWLDVAGYADSEGYTVSDAERPWAWKYRDWVVRSFNEDRPFDRFVAEQLAGDELAGARTGDLSPEQTELLTATGFLRMAADGTGSGANNEEGRNQVIADTLKIVGTSLLGLSVQCAQCHDHRYDPIPQSDYYALRAVFEPALDWQAWKPPVARRVSLYTAADRSKAAEIERQVSKITAERDARQAEFMAQALEKELAKFEEPLRQRLREAYQTSGDMRTAEQKSLLSKHPSLNITTGNLYQYIPESRPKLQEFAKRIERARAEKPTEEFLRALVEPDHHTPETKLFHRGDPQQPKQTVAPAALTVVSPEGSRIEFPLNDEDRPTTGRRLAFARWVASRSNPLAARVIVNRVWMHHFGQGLVTTPADFGKLGAQPVHPELLDWLADEFIASGWSFKRLHRLIMGSTVWRQRTQAAASDSADTMRFRAAPVRLEAETLRDRMLAAAGRLNPTLHGPPLSTKEDETGQVIVEPAQRRRSLYIKARRSQPVSMLQAFDAPVMETNCESRSRSTVATQSLMLLNGDFILDCASALAERVARESEPLSASAVARLPRLPTARPEIWSYGFGRWDAEAGGTAGFVKLGHWTGSQWQGGSALPDPQLGWVLLNASGGHPDGPDRAAVRRWTAPATGKLLISGKLSHSSPNGDGVRARVVSSQSGVAGEWLAQHGSIETSVESLDVRAGDAIDFMVDCRTSVTSDGFQWPVTLLLTTSSGAKNRYASEQQFSGPAEPFDEIPGRIVLAWRLAYGRDPSAEELVLALSFIARQIETLQQDAEAVPRGRTPSGQAMINLCQTLMSSNEFLYVE